jgi:hypothetical protein
MALGVMASGALMANVPGVSAQKDSDVLHGNISKYYNSGTILLDNHHHMIRLADTPIPSRDFSLEAERIKRLTQMVGSGEVLCTKVSVDSYGMDVAHCSNHRGESLNEAIAAF